MMAASTFLPYLTHKVVTATRAGFRSDNAVPSGPYAVTRHLSLSARTGNCGVQTRFSRRPLSWGGARPPRQAMSAFIESHKERYGVEPICQLLPISPSTYDAARSRAASAQAFRDEQLRGQIARVYAQNYLVCGPRKVGRQLNREGVPVTRGTVERLEEEYHSQAALAKQDALKQMSLH